MSAQVKLEELAQRGFALAGESVPLGFEVERITATTDRMPIRLDQELVTLMTNSWPGDFFLGAIEFFGPDRINLEHAELYPGLTVVEQGFLGIGSDGAGSLFSYCAADRRVYLLPSEYFTDDGLRSHAWDKLETTPENIKLLADESWGSLSALFDWALIELKKLEETTDDDPEEDE